MWPRFSFIAFLLVLSGCVSITKQPKDQMILDPSQESAIEGTGTSSADIRSMAERMARDIASLNWVKQKTKLRIALTNIENTTRFAFNPDIIKDRLLTDLVEFSSHTQLQFTEERAGADFILSARITGLSKGSSKGVSDYLLYSFQLVDTSKTVVWMKAYETKKQGKVGTMYR